MFDRLHMNERDGRYEQRRIEQHDHDEGVEEEEGTRRSRHFRCNETERTIGDVEVTTAASRDVQNLQDYK